MASEADEQQFYTEAEDGDGYDSDNEHGPASLQRSRHPTPTSSRSTSPPLHGTAAGSSSGVQSLGGGSSRVPSIGSTVQSPSADELAEEFPKKQFSALKKYENQFDTTLLLLLDNSSLSGYSSESRVFSHNPESKTLLRLLNLRLALHRDYLSFIPDAAIQGENWILEHLALFKANVQSYKHFLINRGQAEARQQGWMSTIFGSDGNKKAATMTRFRISAVTNLIRTLFSVFIRKRKFQKLHESVLHKRRELAGMISKLESMTSLLREDSDEIVGSFGLFIRGKKLEGQVVTQALTLAKHWNLFYDLSTRLNRDDAPNSRYFNFLQHLQEGAAVREEIVVSGLAAIEQFEACWSDFCNKDGVMDKVDLMEKFHDAAQRYGSHQAAVESCIKASHFQDGKFSVVNPAGVSFEGVPAGDFGTESEADGLPAAIEETEDILAQFDLSEAQQESHYHEIVPNADPGPAPARRTPSPSPSRAPPPPPAQPSAPAAPPAAERSVRTGRTAGRSPGNSDLRRKLQAVVQPAVARHRPASSRASSRPSSPASDRPPPPSVRRSRPRQPHAPLPSAVRLTDPLQRHPSPSDSLWSAASSEAISILSQLRKALKRSRQLMAAEFAENGENTKATVTSCLAILERALKRAETAEDDDDVDAKIHEVDKEIAKLGKALANAKIQENLLTQVVKPKLPVWDTADLEAYSGWKAQILPFALARERNGVSKVAIYNLLKESIEGKHKARLSKELNHYDSVKKVFDQLDSEFLLQGQLIPRIRKKIENLPQSPDDLQTEASNIDSMLESLVVLRENNMRSGFDYGMVMLAITRVQIDLQRELSDVTDVDKLEDLLQKRRVTNRRLIQFGVIGGKPKAKASITAATAGATPAAAPPPAAPAAAAGGQTQTPACRLCKGKHKQKHILPKCPAIAPELDMKVKVDACKRSKTCVKCLQPYLNKDHVCHSTSWICKSCDVNFAICCHRKSADKPKEEKKIVSGCITINSTELGHVALNTEQVTVQNNSGAEETVLVCYDTGSSHSEALDDIMSGDEAQPVGDVTFGNFHQQLGAKKEARKGFLKFVTPGGFVEKEFILTSHFGLQINSHRFRPKPEWQAEYGLNPELTNASGYAKVVLGSDSLIIFPTVLDVDPETGVQLSRSKLTGNLLLCGPAELLDSQEDPPILQNNCRVFHRVSQPLNLAKLGETAQCSGHVREAEAGEDMEPRPPIPRPPVPLLLPAPALPAPPKDYLGAVDHQDDCTGGATDGGDEVPRLPVVLPAPAPAPASVPVPLHGAEVEAGLAATPAGAALPAPAPLVPLQ